MNKSISKNPPQVTAGRCTFPITLETYDTLMTGDVPKELIQRIRTQCGEEVAMDFKRKVLLIYRIREQIHKGELPDHLLPIVTNGLPSTEILQKLYEHKLPSKAEQLYRKNLITSKELHVVQTSLLSEEILPALSRALYLNTAEYLCSQSEITKDMLKGFYDGSIDLFYIPIIRRHYRKMKYGDELSEKFHLQAVPTQEDYNTPFVENLSGNQLSLEDMLSQKQAFEKLHEALEWLTPEDQELLRLIYEEKIPITTIAVQRGVDEKTIRWHRNQLLKKLRWILESIHHITPDSIIF